MDVLGLQYKPGLDYRLGIGLNNININNINTSQWLLL